MNEAEDYRVKVENIFEGPMDLLVYLIRKNEVNIYDIPIALITDQYLEYLEWMKLMNIDFAGEFLVMAATLTQIKSKMLLPVHDSEEEDTEDPRLQIAGPLIDYLQAKSIAEQLADRYITGEDVFVREPERPEISPEPEEDVVRIGLFELIDAFRKILDNMPGSHKINLADEKISIKDRMNEIIEVLEAQGSVTFESLFSSQHSKGELIITFLAILEMAKLSLIRISQHVHSGTIRLFYL